MTSELNKRVDLRVSEDDKVKVKELAKLLNVKRSEVWRIALAQLYHEQDEPRK